MPPEKPRVPLSNSQNPVHLYGVAFFCVLATMYKYMEILNDLLPWIQIGLSILLIGSILLQQSGAGMGGAFGGSDGGGFNTRTGAERVFFQATIVLAILFSLSAFIALII